METFGYIVLSILILLVMVLIHESGHYTIAKLLGFTVDEFSVGFGPKLISRRRKNGERFSLRLLPLGGYCAFYGETDEEDTGEKAKEKPTDDVSEAKADETAEESKTSAEEEEQDLLTYAMTAKREEDAKENAAPVRLDKNGLPAKTFNEHKPWKRILVLLGGVLFNFLSAIIFSLIYLWVVGYAVPEVSYVYPDLDGDGTYCELKVNDKILAINGDYITVLDSYDAVRDRHAAGEVGQTLVYTVERGGAIIDVPVTIKKIKYIVEGEDGEKIKDFDGVGIRMTTTFVGNNAGTAFTYCVPYTFKLSWAILGSFGQLISGKLSITQISGPVGSVTLMAELSALDWRNILILLPLLASNLAIFNILPFPALDGAHIVFTAIEWVRKKPINRKVEAWVHAIGMAVLLLFVLVVDILSFAL